MKKYALKVTHVYFLPAVVCILLSIAVALFALTGIKTLMIIFVPFSAVVVLITTAACAEILHGYKVSLTDDKLIMCVPKQLGEEDVKINWVDIKNITFVGKKHFIKSISVNSEGKSAVIPITAFKEHTDLLKAIIRRSCDNDGFYAEQNVLEFLKNE